MTDKTCPGVHVTEQPADPEDKRMLASAREMMDNLNLQIQITYDYQQLRALYMHRSVVQRVIDKYDLPGDAKE